MKTMLYLFFGFFSVNVLASQWSGTVVELSAAANSNAVLFKLSGELKSAIRCNEYEMYAIDLRAPGGDSQLELIKLALAQNLHVEAEGLNSCAAHWKSEGVKEIRIH